MSIYVANIWRHTSVYGNKSSAVAEIGRHASVKLFVIQPNLMLANFCCFKMYGSYKGFKQQRWLSRSFKGIDNGAIR